MKHSKIIFVISMLVVMLVFFTRCINNAVSSNTDARGNKYAGAASCTACHKDIAASFAHNNHYKTSSPVDPTILKKLITTANNNFFFMDSSHILVEEKDGILSQSYFVKNQKTITAKFDVAFGSAEKAQTYAYWKGDKLFQLPLTYFTAMKTWANSPGFTVNHANYNRIIEGRCFECHASYIDKEMVQSGSLAVSEKLDKNSIIYGIDCERCHGPAADHVKYQQQNPESKKAMFITSMHSLSRQQQLDVCAVCHSGNDQSTQRSLFGFLPADTLANFYFPDFGSGKTDPDVHGKQMQLLQSSKCFQLSKMTCATCHDTHKENTTATFISTCMSCHQNSSHALNNFKENEQADEGSISIDKNCISCHMPLQSSKTIFFNNTLRSEKIPYFLTTHKIAIYK